MVLGYLEDVRTSEQRVEQREGVRQERVPQEQV